MQLPASPAYRLYQWLWMSLDWLYPPRCGGCNQRGGRWCVACQNATEVIGLNTCQRCGIPLAAAGTCYRCRSSQFHYEALRSWAVFSGPLRQALHRLKYGHDVSLGEMLARPLLQTLQNLSWPVDVVVPVPLGAQRLRERGYNQSALLARPVALGRRVAYRPDAVRRVRETRSQVGLSYLERQDNVRDSFRANPSAVSQRVVLVVDDVATSGATLDACAQALVEADARQVYCLTLARAL